MSNDEVAAITVNCTRERRRRKIDAMSNALKTTAVVRMRDTDRMTDLDRVAVEEPLEVRLHNRPFATIMRTPGGPGTDEALAAGFLLSERVLRDADELGAIEYCRDATI